MSVFDNIRKLLDKVSTRVELSKDEQDYLLSHKSIKKADLVVDGETYPAWRIIQNNALGPGKGGIRFHPDVSEDEVMSLSFWMSIKNSLVGLPYGGAKGGVKVNPKSLSQKQIEELSREYVRKFHESLGQDKDIPAPDVYTNSQIMAWMLDEFEEIKGHHEPGMITGKPMELGGCAIREDATSRGGLIVLEEFLKRRGKKPHELRIAIQGFGNAGKNIAKMLHDKGYRVLAVSDSKGAICSESLDIEAVIEHKDKTGSVVGFTDAIDDILTQDVDVLVLAALENQITKDNASDIKASYILELANGPITFEADEALTSKGIIVIPDILANAGGVVASYCEWSQSKIGHILSAEAMYEVLHSRMVNAFHSVYEGFQEQKDDGVSMRIAAYAIAIKRILRAARLRGEV